MFNYKGIFAVLAVTVASIFFSIMPTAVFAASTVTISSVTVNSTTFPGGSAISVTPGQTITATLNATNSTTTDWIDTGFDITNLNTPSFSGSCVATANATSTGAHTPTITFTVPNNANGGTDNLYLEPFSSSTCSTQNSVGNFFKATGSLRIITAAPASSTVDVILNVSGGTAQSSNFTVTVGGSGVNANPPSFSGNTSGTIVTVNPGSTYTIGASSLTNYTENNSGACMASLIAGASSTCTITELYSPAITTATLNVVLGVDNTQGGSSTPSDFTVTVNGASANPGSFAGNTSGTPITVTGATAYAISESSIADYNASFSGNCAGPIAAGGTDTCTIVETFNPTVIATSTPNEIQIIPSSLTAGTVNTAYLQTLTASTAATGTFNWSIASGTLPAGLSLSTSTGSTATISGTPNATGTSDFAIAVTAVNGDASTTQNYSLSVSVPTPPNGGSDLNCTLPTSGNLIADPDMNESSTFLGIPHCWASGGYGSSTILYTYPVAGPTANDQAAQVSISNYTTGAAEWYFQNVPVNAGALYAFSDSYNATVASELVAQWTLTDGSFAYDTLGMLPSTSGTWTTSPQEIFQAPINASSVTILHLIQNNGTIAETDYSLTSYAPSSQNSFSKALVSLTFDDGWESQYDNALPILTAAKIPGTFYIITSHIGEPGDNLFASSDVSTSTITTTSTATWPNLYVDPTNQEYVFNDSYSATAPSTVTAAYMVNGVFTSTVIGTLPAANTTSTATLSFLLPTVTSSTVTPISILQSLTGSGTLTASNPSLIEYPPYMNPSQLLTLQSDGEDVGNHTVNHCDLTTGLCPDVSPTTPDALTPTEEISNGQTALASLGVSSVTTFAYPFGDYNPSVESILSGDQYANARTVDVGYNSVGYDPLALKTYSVVASTTFAQVQSWINTAIANKWWLVLTFHDVDPANILAANDETYGTTPQIFQQIVSYLSMQEASGTVSVADMANAIATLDATSTPPTPPTPAPTISLAPANGTILASGTVGTLYTASLTASSTNASDTFTWTITGLPAGLTSTTTSSGSNGSSTNNNIAKISGTPTASGTATIFASVRGANPSSTPASATYSLTINALVATSTPTSTTPTSTPPTPSSTIPVITISTASPLPDGTAGAAYDQFIAATSTVAGNTLTWSVATGTLPDGLNLNTATGELSGTPGTQNTFSFAITVANGSANASTTASSTQNYTLTIDPAPVVVITPPAPPTGGSTSGGGSVTSGGGGGGGGGGSFYTPLPTASTSTTSGNVGGGVVLGASTTNELALLQSLMAQLVSLEQQLVTMNFKQNSCPATFTENLSQGMTDPQVQNLQKVLNYTSLTQVAQTGAGSPGNESTYFGSATKAAVIAFQNIFAAQILAPNGLTAGNGYVGAATRNELNQLCSQ